MAQKPSGHPPGKPATAPAPPATGGRKPWKKRTPVDIVLQQGEKLRAEIAEMEDELKKKREQLKKFDEIRKVFDAG